MASFEDRVRQIVEPDLEDIRNLFLDDVPREQPAPGLQPRDLEPIEKQLKDLLTWVKNVKSEVRQIYVTKPEKKEEEQKEDKPITGYDPDDAYKRLLDGSKPDTVTKLRDWLHGFYTWLGGLFGVDADLIKEIERRYYEWADSLSLPNLDKFKGWNRNDSGHFAPPIESDTNYAPEIPSEHDVDDVFEQVQFLIKCCHQLKKEISTSEAYNPPDSRLQTQIMLIRRFPTQSMFCPR